MFKADRIVPREPTGPRFTPMELSEEQLTDFARRSVGSASWRYRARGVVAGVG
jgi:hypothetical protein